MSASQALLAIAGGLFALLGMAHGVMALRDVARPATFRPSDDVVLQTMRASDVAAMPGATLWRAWLGLNLTHSLGLLVFGGLLLGLASAGNAWLADHPRYGGRRRGGRRGLRPRRDAVLLRDAGGGGRCCARLPRRRLGDGVMRPVTSARRTAAQA